jgi:hypothetical protein
MKRNRDPKIENTAQAEAFQRMAGNEQETISLYAADFHSVIRDYKRTHAGEIPTADDLLWIENQILNRDITEG